MDFDQGDSPLPGNQDKLRAFKLLVHAEIESYIENAVLEVWNKCDHEWRINNRVITPLGCLLMFSSSKFEANDKQLVRNSRISQSLESFKIVVANNNGIKRKNILQLVIPFGVDYSHIDQTWLSTIESYGNSRGLVAHNSYSVQKQLDKKDELGDLGIVLMGLKEVDMKIQKASRKRGKLF